MPDDERRRILAFYQACLRKHLYVHGTDKRLLSKNAAFAPLAQSLSQQFPDARFIICLRDPIETIPSQLSSIAPGLRFFGIAEDSQPIRERLLEQLAFYYDNLQALVDAHPPRRCVTVTLAELKHGLSAAMTGIYTQLGLPLSDAFADVLRSEAPAARGYRSGHRYTLTQFGLEPADIRTRFASAYRHPGLRGASAAAARNSGEIGPAADLQPGLRHKVGKVDGTSAVDREEPPTTEPRGAMSC
jgi:hypothetical protein